MSVFFSIREVVEMAISTERSGQIFYQTASKQVREKSLEELFRYLAGEEEKHLKVFQDFYNTLKERPETTPYNWEEAKLYLEALVNSRFFSTPDKAINLAREAKSEIEAIDSAINFEKETLLFFYEMVELVKSQDCDLIKKVIEEEKKHIRRLFTLKGKLSHS